MVKSYHGSLIFVITTLIVFTIILIISPETVYASSCENWTNFMWANETADSYLATGNWSLPVSRIYDGNWRTYSMDSYDIPGYSYLYINYTKPYGATTADWFVGDDGNSCGLDCWWRRISINESRSLQCFNALSNVLAFRIQSNFSDDSWQCWDGSGWKWLRNPGGSSVGHIFFEENVSWYDNRTMWIHTDDNSAETQAILSNRNDKFLKFIKINSTCHIKDARVWIYGKSSNCDMEGEKVLMKIAHHDYYFDPCEKFGSNFSWESHRINKYALYNGVDYEGMIKIGFATLDTSEKSRKLHIGRDKNSTGQDMIYQNNRKRKGQLMVRLEICKDTCLNTSFPR